MAHRRKIRLTTVASKRRLGFFQSFEKWFFELAAGIIYLVVCIILLTASLHYKSKFAETDGKITSQQPIDSYSTYHSSGKTISSNPYYVYEVTYQVNGEEFYSNQYANSSDSLKPGDTVKVKYCRNNPKELIDYTKINSNSIMGIIISIILIGIGISDSKIIHIP